MDYEAYLLFFSTIQLFAIILVVYCVVFVSFFPLPDMLKHAVNVNGKEGIEATWVHVLKHRYFAVYAFLTFLQGLLFL